MREARSRSWKWVALRQAPPNKVADDDRGGHSFDGCEEQILRESRRPAPQPSRGATKETVDQGQKGPGLRETRRRRFTELAIPSHPAAKAGRRSCNQKMRVPRPALPQKHGKGTKKLPSLRSAVSWSLRDHGLKLAAAAARELCYSADRVKKK
jgi:hypothetical protein